MAEVSRQILDFRFFASLGIFDDKEHFPIRFQAPNGVPWAPQKWKMLEKRSKKHYLPENKTPDMSM